MRIGHFESITPICVVCRRRGEQHDLTVHQVVRSPKGKPDQVLEGLLQCTHCQREYPIIDGVPVLLADLTGWVGHSGYQLSPRSDLTPVIDSVLGDLYGSGSAWELIHMHGSSYGFDHYGEFDPAEPANPRFAPGSVARLLRHGLATLPFDPVPHHPLLDLGCGVGRTTLELAQVHPGLVLGIDLNLDLLRRAQAVIQTGTFTYDRREVGLVYTRRSFDVPLAAQHAERVDYWLADATELPFKDAQWGGATSLHLIDSISNPYQHLHEVSRVLSPKGPLLFSTPFDWMGQVTERMHWLGGHSARGPARGDSAAVLTELLQGDPNGLALQLLQTTEADWTMRIHARCHHIYRCFMGVAEVCGSTHHRSN